MARTYHGTNYTPPDHYAKVTGRARYAEDWRADGMLFAKCMLSPMPHCRVRKIDASAALAMPGVHAILTEEDLPEHDPLDETCVTNEPLFEGQAILAVAADNEWIAADAIEKIKVDLEPLPFALDPLDSLRPGGPNARRDGNVIVRDTPSEPGEPPKNVVKEQKWTADAFAKAGGARLPETARRTSEWAIGDVAKGFEEADFVIDRPLYHQSNTHHPLEPRSCMAYWQGGKLFLYPSTQSITITHAVTAALARRRPRRTTILICEFCGGGFGSKILGTVNMPIPALLSKKTGRPVMHRVSRYEENYMGRARAGLPGAGQDGLPQGRPPGRARPLHRPGQRALRHPERHDLGRRGGVALVPADEHALPRGVGAHQHAAALRAARARRRSDHGHARAADRRRRREARHRSARDASPQRARLVVEVRRQPGPAHQRAGPRGDRQDQDAGRLGQRQEAVAPEEGHQGHRRRRRALELHRGRARVRRTDGAAARRHARAPHRGRQPGHALLLRHRAHRGRGARLPVGEGGADLGQHLEGAALDQRPGRAR